jgi:hypothetical protein
VETGLYPDVLPLSGPIEGDTTADLDDHAGKLGDEMEEVLAKRLLDGLIEIRPCFEISAIAPAARAQTVCEKFSSACSMIGFDLLARYQRPVLPYMSEERRQEAHVLDLEQPGRVIREHYFYRIYDADRADRPVG